MPPKTPQSLAVAIFPAFVSLLLSPNPASAQTWQEQIGYTLLVAEQGSSLSPTAGSPLSYIPEQSSSWRYWTGDLDAPANDWRLPSFTEPVGWLDGQTSIGYADSDDNTTLSGMQGNFTTVYLRHQFDIPAGQVPALLHLRLYVDDGAIVWLNGTEIARSSNVTSTEPGPSATASSAVNNASWQDYFIPGAGGIVTEGSNTIAIHALNASVNSSDFSIDIELSRPRIDFGQVESGPSDTFLPDASPNSSPALGEQFQGTATFSHKTFEIRTISGVSFTASSHAANVGTFSYRYSNTPGYFLPLIKNWESTNFIGSGLLNSGTSLPDPSFTHVQNHSWIATTENHTKTQLNRFIRRFDFMASRDKTLCAIGLNNLSNTEVPEVWGCAYNCIAVGRTDGQHSRGGTVSGVDGTGRVKPDIVAPGNELATSYSTANVSSCAALLLGHAYDHPGLSKVFHPEVSKSILMAGATKNTNWSRTTSQPLDPIYGAGTLNIYNSFHLLEAGQHPAGATRVPASGWDYSELDQASTSTYSFVIPEGQLATECSIVLTWFRQFEENPAANNFATLPTLPDFELRIYESQNGTPGTQLDLSDSPVDNVEHVYLQNLLPGEYTISVATDTSSSYAIAWNSRLSTQPEVAIDAIDASSGSVSLSLENLLSGETYTLQYSEDLITWNDLFTVTAGSSSEPFTQSAIPIGTRAGFYRITWTPE